MYESEVDDALPGQDSFVDVVCNMVGILIVLVVILGVRSAGTEPEKPVAATPAIVGAGAAESTPGAADVERAIANTSGQIEEAVVRMNELTVQAVLTEARRDELAVLLAAVKEEVAQRRSKLDDEAQRKFDVQAAIADANLKLQGLTQEQVRLLAQSATVEEIEHIPTALAKSLDDDGDMLHVRLAYGNLSVIPINELSEERLAQNRDYFFHELSRRDYAGVKLGPIDGYVIDFELSKEESAEPVVTPVSRIPSGATPLRFLAVFTPVTSRIGEPLSQALQPDSEFMQRLTANRASTSAVVVWVYPDSYEELRELKRWLWEANIALAVMPRNAGQPIVMGSRGIRPRAQ